MTAGVFELFRIGIGPSSSHTVGPMRAARRFLQDARTASGFDRIHRVRVDLFGSLALTGVGHATDRAILLGLAGEEPETVDVDAAARVVGDVAASRKINLLGVHMIGFDSASDLVFRKKEFLPGHPNAMRFAVFDVAGSELFGCDYYSVGGGFIVAEGEAASGIASDGPALPFPFESAADLLRMAEDRGLTIAELVFANEAASRPDAVIRDGLDGIWAAMDACINRGLATQGELPGPFKIRRRAPGLYRQILARDGCNDAAGRVRELDWVTTFAIAVNEENAAGGRVVTAPTNGAAGIIPAVLAYYCRSHPKADSQKIREFLLTAAAIGALCKRNASISGAEVGCQGEVGVACSMAAAGLAAVLGGSNAQIENAAEIGMEHSLGLTCDPVGGLVQIPCIERNAIGATKAIAAAQLALSGNGTHYVALDRVIETMRQTGADMQTQYKETSLAGLAVNVTLC